MEKAVAPHSSTLAWKIPWTEEPGGLQSTGSLRQTRLSGFTFTFHFHALEKEMATHSSVLAWRIRGTGEPGGLPSMGSHGVGHDWSDLAAAAAGKQSKGWLSPLEADFSEEQRPLGEAKREGPGKEVFLTLIAQLLSSLSRADLELRGFIREKEGVSSLLIIQASLITQLVKNRLQCRRPGFEIPGQRRQELGN